MINIGIIEDNYFQLSSYKEFLEDFQECRVVFACKSMEAFRALPSHEMDIEKEGYSYKTMADHLHLSVFTINHHLKKIYQKLNVSSKSELVSRICLNNLY